MEVIEVNNVVLHILCTEHDVSYQFSIGRNMDTQCIFYRPDGCERMHGGANTAYAAYKCPRIARIAAAKNFFNQANHGAGAVGFFNLSVFYFRLNAEVSFNTGYRIYYYACHG